MHRQTNRNLRFRILYSDFLDSPAGLADGQLK
jgi:hypothetical protein